MILTFTYLAIECYLQTGNRIGREFWATGGVYVDGFGEFLARVWGGGPRGVGGCEVLRDGGLRGDYVRTLRL